MVLNRRDIRAAVVAALFAVGLAIPAAAASPAVNLPSLHIDNFGIVNANYYRGAQPKGHDYADLAALGVKSVIDLTDDDADSAEPAMTKSAGMRSFKIPMSTRKAPTAEQLSQFLKIVNDPANQPVYVHCVGGRHRTGVMTAAYRMTDESWTAEKAFAEMKQYKFGADFLHPEFRDFVYAFKPQPKEAVSTIVALSTRP